MFKNYLFNNRPLTKTIQDPVPNSFSLIDINLREEDGGNTYYHDVNCAQITGVSDTITLKIVGAANDIAYYVGAARNPLVPDCPDVLATSAGNPTYIGNPNVDSTGFTMIDSSPFFLDVDPDYYIQFAGDSGETSVTIYNASDNDTLLASFESTFTPYCFLTVSAVNYKGLEDAGAELTAMRQLRERYAVEDADLIAEYNTTSPQIIQAVEQQGLEEEVYEEIYQVILTIQLAISEDRWEDARQEYKDLYSNLKERFV
jgi:hypothetical protein